MKRVPLCERISTGWRAFSNKLSEKISLKEISFLELLERLSVRLSTLRSRFSSTSELLNQKLPNKSRFLLSRSILYNEKANWPLVVTENDQNA